MQAVRKGLRPRRDKAVTEPSQPTEELSIPDDGHTIAMRLYQSSFRIEIWRKNDRASNGKVWALILTSSLKDDRINAVKGVWRERKVLEMEAECKSLINASSLILFRLK